MTDRDAMLRAIAANPDDDTPRLIYADLLDELGGDLNTARARFIRLQIETHQPADYDPTPVDFDPALDLLDERETIARDRKRAEAEHLANRYSGEWLKELPTWCNPMFGHVEMTRVNLFARGFVERVTARSKQFTLRADELFETPIRAIELQGGSAKLVPAMMARPELAQLRSLSFSWPDAPPDLAGAIAECARLSGLIFLDLLECGFGSAEVRALAQSVCLPSLRRIRLGGSPTLAAVRALAASAKLGSLRGIDLLACKPRIDCSDIREEFPDKLFLSWGD
jgi:uncharacterized protein (TIGR02996 family)